jgi:hypothetical protein
MSKGLKILLTIIAILAILVLIAWGAYAFWTRPGRLDQTTSRALVVKAWETTRSGEPSGELLLRMDLGGRDLIRPGVHPVPQPFDVPAERIRDLFPQQEPDEVFFNRVSIAHMGRVWVAGRWCERVRLSPRNYEGQSVELWVDPDGGLALGWRRLEADGAFVRGYRYLRTQGAVAGGEHGPGISSHVEDILDMAGGEAIPPERLSEFLETGFLVEPSWLPDGFELTGGRIFTAPMMGRMQFRNRGQGSEDPILPRHYQLVYSDGLNTISIIEFPHNLPAGVSPDSARLSDILSRKSSEIRRIFHTSMAARVYPIGIALLFGEVSKEVLDRVAASLPESAFAGSPDDEIWPPGIPPPGLPGPGGEGGPGFGGPGFGPGPYGGPGGRRGPSSDDDSPD